MVKVYSNDPPAMSRVPAVSFPVQSPSAARNCRLVVPATSRQVPCRFMAAQLGPVGVGGSQTLCYAAGCVSPETMVVGRHAPGVRMRNRRDRDMNVNRRK